MVEELPGHRLYYSLSGAAGSWQAIGNQASVGRVSLSVELAGPWLQGASLYLLWAE